MDFGSLLELARALPAGAVAPSPERLLIGTLTAPLFGLGAVGALYARSILHLAWLKREVEERLDLTTSLPNGRIVERSAMQWRADRLAASMHTAALPYGGVAREADHFFLGVEPWAKFPVLLDLELLLEHFYCSGHSGSGKTSKLMLPLALELARRGEAVVIFDLKGDAAMFNALREYVPPERFRYFSLERGRGSDPWNPFSSLDMRARSEAELTELIVDALELSYGNSYGRSYYSLGNRQGVTAALQYLKVKHRDWPNVGFREIYMALVALGTTPKAKRAAEGLSHIIVPEALDPEGRNPLELLGRIAALTNYDQLCLNPTALTAEQRERLIIFETAIENRQVLYFNLPGVLGSSVTRTTCLLALHALWFAASRRRSTHPVYVFLDEVQRISSVKFKDMMAQARQPARLALIMASQTEAQLQDPDVDMRPIIQATTRVRANFAVDDPKIMSDMIEQSGEEVEEVTSRGFTVHSTGDWSRSEVVTPVRVPKLKKSDIAYLRNHPHAYLLYCPRGSGYTQYGGGYVGVLATWSLPKALYDEWNRPDTWPAPLPGQIVSADSCETIDVKGAVLAKDLTLSEPEPVRATSTAESMERVKAVAEEKLSKLLADQSAGDGKKGRRRK
jgi:hypothetical protein